MKHKIHYRVGNDGNVTLIDVHGSGQNCQDITASIDKAIGVIDEKSRETTAAAYEAVDDIKIGATYN